MKSPVIARRLGWSLLVAASIGGCSSQAGDVVISQQPIEGAPSESIVPNKELVFTDPSITDGQDADDRFDGPFSFRYLIEQMTPVGVHPGDFAEKWIREELKGRSFNGFAASETVREVDEFVSDPNLFSRGPDGKLDFVRTPFQLAVIANRIDLDDGGAPGELRFDFTIGQKFKRATKPDESDVVNVPNQNGTVIFEYHFTPIAGVGDS